MLDDDLEDYEYKERETRYEVVGKPEGFDESCTLDFRSPYGCSKGAADQYMLDYSRNYGLKNIVFRHSSIFGGRQYSTFDQGWVGWFVKQALIKKVLFEFRIQNINSSMETFPISIEIKVLRVVIQDPQNVINKIESFLRS